MKRAIALFLCLTILFSVAVAEKNHIENVLKMEYAVRVDERVLNGEYTGETTEGKPHGYGLFVFYDTKRAFSAHYLGEWKNGEMHGEGGLYCDNGESQIGFFEQNRMVRGELRASHVEWRYIDYHINDHGCYDIIDNLGNGKSFHGCVNPQNDLYHQGILYTPNGEVEIDTDSGKLYPAAVDSTEVGDGPTYILNTKSRRFHIPSCDSVERTKEENKQNFYGEREELISRKYEPCGNCNP